MNTTAAALAEIKTLLARFANRFDGLEASFDGVENRIDAITGELAVVSALVRETAQVLENLINALATHES